jgi:hypothetical protein
MYMYYISFILIVNLLFNKNANDYNTSPQEYIIYYMQCLIWTN